MYNKHIREQVDFQVRRAAGLYLTPKHLPMMDVTGAGA
jgi:hypothetical protein